MERARFHEILKVLKAFTVNYGRILPEKMVIMEMTGTFRCFDFKVIRSFTLYTL